MRNRFNIFSNEELDNSTVEGQAEVIEQTPADQITKTEQYEETKCDAHDCVAAIEESTETISDIENNIEHNEELIEKDPDKITEDNVIVAQETLYLSLGKLGYGKNNISDFKVSFENCSNPVQRLIETNNKLKLSQEVFWDKTKSIFLTTKKKIDKYAKETVDQVDYMLNEVKELKSIFSKNFDIDSTKKEKASKFISAYTSVNDKVEINNIFNLLKNSLNIKTILAFPLIQKYNDIETNTMISILNTMYNKANHDSYTSNLIQSFYKNGKTKLLSRGDDNSKNFTPYDITDINKNEVTLLGGVVWSSMMHGVEYKQEGEFSFFVVYSSDEPVIVNYNKSSEILKDLNILESMISYYKQYANKLNSNYVTAYNQFNNFLSEKSFLEKMKSREYINLRQHLGGCMKNLNREVLGKIDQYYNTISNLIKFYKSIA